MIFRRRTTDQVYATLQQVQRRITESGSPSGPQPVGSGSPRPGAPALRPMATGPTVGVRPPVAFPTPPPDGPAPFSPTPGPMPAIVPASSASGGSLATALGGHGTSSYDASPSRGWLVSRSIVLTFGLTMVVMMLIVGVLAYRAGASSVAAPSQTPVEPPAAVAPPATESDGGDAIFVLWQGRVNPTEEAKVRKTAAEYNNAAGNLGIKPYFDVRQHESGNLQFYFGKIHDRIGVDRRKFNDAVERTLAAPKAKGGQGWSSGYWTTVKADAK